jgi:hypothetical protein
MGPLPSYRRHRRQEQNHCSRRTRSLDQGAVAPPVERWRQQTATQFADTYRQMAAGVATGRHCVVPSRGIATALVLRPALRRAVRTTLRRHSARALRAFATHGTFAGLLAALAGPSHRRRTLAFGASCYPHLRGDNHGVPWAQTLLAAVVGIPALRRCSRPSTCRNPFFFLGVSVRVNSRLQVNVLIKPRVVKAKYSPAALWITRITGITSVALA